MIRFYTGLVSISMVVCLLMSGSSMAEKQQLSKVAQLGLSSFIQQSDVIVGQYHDYKDVVLACNQCRSDHEVGNEQQLCVMQIVPAKGKGEEVYNIHSIGKVALEKSKEGKFILCGNLRSDEGGLGHEIKYYDVRALVQSH